MPTSAVMFLTPVAETIVVLNPKRVLDVGIGLGKWGMMVREYTDAWNQRIYYPSVSIDDPSRTYLAGIEIHKEYKNPLWTLYNDIYVGEALQVIRELDKENEHFDMIIMIDVIEHMPKKDGLELLSLFQKIGRKSLVSYANSKQTGTATNPHEEHISEWELKDFPKGSKGIIENYYYGLYLINGDNKV